MGKPTVSAAERRYMARVAELGCYLCRVTGLGSTPAQVHHVRLGSGMSERPSHWLTVPLCDPHHANSSPDGIHGQRRAWRNAGVDEMDALADTIRCLNTMPSR